MNYKTPEIILWGVTVEYGFATSPSCQNDQIYFTIASESDNEFTI